MSVISQLNSTISSHNMTANLVALMVLASVSGVSVAAINRNGEAIKSSYDTLVLPVTADYVPATKTPARPVQAAPTTTVTAPLTIQSQPTDVVSQLQPARSLADNAQASASSLQPSANSVQLTGANPQNASSVN